MGDHADDGARALAEDLPPLLEDSGADTQDRYSWQHHCTAVDALRMAKDQSIRRIVCEVHEDYVIEYESGIELVSCKHREASSGPWKLTELCSKGGVAHLFGRWEATKALRLRLMTNAGLQPGKNESGKLAEACARRAEGCTPGEVREMAMALAGALLAAGRGKDIAGIPQTDKPKRHTDLDVPPDFLTRVEEFMAVLVIRADLPARAHMREYVIGGVVRPLLHELEMPDTHAVHQYEACVALVAERNRSNGVTGRFAEWLTGEVPEGQRGSQLALITARSIRPDEIKACLRTRGSTPLLRRWSTPGHDRLRAKLVAGGIGPTRANSATRLREAWLAAWAKMRTGLPGDVDERDDLEARVLEIAGDAEAFIATSGGDWGNPMYEELKARLSANVDSLGSPLQLTAELLMGIAMDLTAECEVWFSAEFDVEAALTVTAAIEHEGQLP